MAAGPEQVAHKTSQAGQAEVAESGVNPFLHNEHSKVPALSAQTPQLAPVAEVLQVVQTPFKS